MIHPAGGMRLFGGRGVSPLMGPPTRFFCAAALHQSVLVSQARASWPASANFTIAVELDASRTGKNEQPGQTVYEA